MCGIVGFGKLPLHESERIALLRRMCDTIVHRGPDNEGYYTDEIVGLGMRRLSIIDLSKGDQPIHSADGKKHIVFNGEIYNYQELRSTLQNEGYVFKTDCDTEVILAQYERDGAACVHCFNGMFAFAIWDEVHQCLFLARDRLGVKPLYYYWDGTHFLFSSEIKALMASGFVKKDVNQHAIWDYLTFRYVPQPETIWENIYKLPPAHTLTFSSEANTPQIKRYWDIPYTNNVSRRSYKEYEEEFTELFLDAVRLRLIADVPVGILLSGGLDSSAVTAAVAERHNARLSSFSVAFADSPETDETPYARLVAQKLGTDHHEIVIGQKEFLDFLPRLTHYTDEPLADLACVPLYYVSSLAREHVKVVLSGEGSDEILGGYDFSVWVSEFDRRRAYQHLPKFLRQSPGINLLKKIFPKSFQEKYSLDDTSLNQQFLPIPVSATSYLSTQEKQALFNQSQPWDDSIDQVRQALARTQNTDPLHQILYVYSQDWLVEDLLMKADRMSMANSIELRTPFLDYRLVEWAAKTPSYIKVGRDKDGKYATKRILRSFASKRLPQEIIQREKKGFPVPVYDWLSGPLKPWVFDVLGGQNTKISRWFEPSEINRFVMNGVKQNSPLMDRHYLWAILILELWSQMWLMN
jgi:asparagine synthase (glutamine-hydrolysing)